MVTGTAREEERAARERQRHLDRMHKAAQDKRAKERGAKLRAIIREELARKRGCRCGITPATSMSEIMALGAGCTAGTLGHAGYVCPTVDAIRRRMGR